MVSKITGGPAEKVFSLRILNKYDVNYFMCRDTGFIQTEEPYWLEEAYSSAINQLDIGLATRNEQLRDSVLPLINRHFNPAGRFLDYAGGYGLFTRMMRDKGYDFYHTDAYCDNIFAEFFDLSNLEQAGNFELVTAFEVFEHLPQPLSGIEDMLQYGDNVLFSTVLHPGLGAIKDWWYLIPETGQHIALYTKESLDYLAKKFGMNVYSNGETLHLFTKKAFAENPLISPKLPYLIATMKRKVDRYFRKLNGNRESLLQKDWEMIKGEISRPPAGKGPLSDQSTSQA